MTRPNRHNRRGFSLIEVLVASVILALGCTSILALFAQSQRLMMVTSDLETAQRVLNYFEMVHPMPTPDQVTDDPLTSDLLRISPERAENLCEELEIELTRQDREDIAGYVVERKVDAIDDKELERNGGIYTVRTIVTWGSTLHGEKPEKETVVKLWWKGAASK